MPLVTLVSDSAVHIATKAQKQSQRHVNIVYKLTPPYNRHKHLIPLSDPVETHIARNVNPKQYEVSKPINLPS